LTRIRCHDPSSDCDGQRLPIIDQGDFLLHNHCARRPDIGSKTVQRTAGLGGARCLNRNLNAHSQSGISWSLGWQESNGLKFFSASATLASMNFGSPLPCWLPQVVAPAEATASERVNANALKSEVANVVLSQSPRGGLKLRLLQLTNEILTCRQVHCAQEDLQSRRRVGSLPQLATGSHSCRWFGGFRDNLPKIIR